MSARTERLIREVSIPRNAFRAAVAIALALVLAAITSPTREAVDVVASHQEPPK